jgi:uroporphyrinogen-III synthase
VISPSNHVLVTRPAHQSQQLCECLLEAGFKPITFPTIDIVPLPIDHYKKHTLENISTFDFVLFISANAVHQVIAYKTLWPSENTRYIAIGPSTAEAMVASLAITPDFISSKPFSSEQLMTQLPSQLADKRILIIKGEGGRDFLANELKNKDMIVKTLDTYRRSLPTNIAPHFKHSDIAYITITSILALKNLTLLLQDDFSTMAKRCVFVLFSERIEQYAKQIGCTHTIVSNNANNDSLVQAIKQSTH